MKRRSGFTLIELMVVVAIIALLMSILMPALGRAKKQAQAVACQVRLKHWALIYKLYIDDSDGYFYEGRGWTQHPGRTGHEQNGWWMNALRPYYKDSWEMLLCPSATAVAENIYDFGTSKAYYISLVNRYRAYREATTKTFTASYGENSWISYMLANQNFSRRVEFFWKGTQNIKDNPNNIPVFGDSTWVDGWPFDTDTPPPTPDYWQMRMGNATALNELDQFCIDRHNGGINLLFMDWTVRKVGLKELWTLKWHRLFNTKGSWTIAGFLESCGDDTDAARVACHRAWSDPVGGAAPWLSRFPEF